MFWTVRTVYIFLWKTNSPWEMFVFAFSVKILCLLVNCSGPLRLSHRRREKVFTVKVRFFAALPCFCLLPFFSVMLCLRWLVWMVCWWDVPVGWAFSDWFAVVYLLTHVFIFFLAIINVQKLDIGIFNLNSPWWRSSITVICYKHVGIILRNYCDFYGRSWKKR